MTTVDGHANKYLYFVDINMWIYLYFYVNASHGVEASNHKGMQTLEHSPLNVSVLLLTIGFHLQ